MRSILLPVAVVVAVVDTAVVVVVVVALVVAVHCEISAAVYHLDEREFIIK